MSLIASKLILKLHANDLQPNWLKLCIFLIFLMQMPTECETREFGEKYKTFEFTLT